MVRHTAAFLDPRSRFCAETARGETPKAAAGSAASSRGVENCQRLEHLPVGGLCVCDPWSAVAYSVYGNMLIRLS